MHGAPAYTVLQPLKSQSFSTTIIVIILFFLSIGPNPCQAQRVLSSQGDLICFKVENEHLSSTKENLQEFICQQGRFHLISAQFEITLALQLFIS